MKLNEFQGKKLLEKEKISLPWGKLAISPDEVRMLAGEWGKGCVLKAQIPTGGRGKAGLIKSASSPGEAETLSKDIFGKTHRGYQVEKILVEEKLNIKNELYLSFGVNADDGAIDMLVSSRGGVVIEATVEKDATAISKTTFSPSEIPSEYQIRNVWRTAGFRGPLLLKLADISHKLSRLFFFYDLMLAEINPLVILVNGD
ncbi:MAG: hypothetical protein LBT15_01290, partial [Synergistaceae bacterium]|nr:hypothetical protein [Synergistaceae bacterium]